MIGKEIVELTSQPFSFLSPFFVCVFNRYINRCALTSGRRIEEWGVAKSLRLFLVLSLSYTYKASPQSLNELANKVYTPVR